MDAFGEVVSELELGVFRGEVRPDVEEIVNSIGMKLLRISPGRFVMGSPKEEPGRSEAEHPHEVQITRRFTWASSR